MTAKRCIYFGAMLLSVLVLSEVAHAQQQIVTAQCTTDETGGDGVRHSCSSAPSKLTAPDGFVIAQNSLNGGEKSWNGSSHDCVWNWAEFVEVLPNSGITQPKTFILHAEANGPKGHWAGRGWENCEYTMSFAKYK